jgi:hypothetical protein
MNQKLAEEVSFLCLKTSSDFNAKLISIQEQCTDKEFEKSRLSTGKVLAEILLEFMNPIYDEHPELRPEGLGGSYKVNYPIHDSTHLGNNKY